MQFELLPYNQLQEKLNTRGHFLSDVLFEDLIEFIEQSNWGTQDDLVAAAITQKTYRFSERSYPLIVINGNIALRFSRKDRLVIALRKTATRRR